jgi:hypothetical protein
VLNSVIKRLRNRIAQARHDIEAIEIHIASEDAASSSPEHIKGLRGLQEMYRRRIAQIDAEILASPLAKDGNPEGEETVVAFSLESLDHPRAKVLRTPFGA